MPSSAGRGRELETQDGGAGLGAVRRWALLTILLVFGTFVLFGVPAVMYGSSHLAQGGAAVAALAFGWAFLTLAGAGMVAYLTRAGEVAETSSSRTGIVTVSVPRDPGISTNFGSDTITGPGGEMKRDAGFAVGSGLPRVVIVLSAALLLLTVLASFRHHPAPVPALVALAVPLLMMGWASRAAPAPR